MWGGRQQQPEKNGTKKYFDDKSLFIFMFNIPKSPNRRSKHSFFGNTYTNNIILYRIGNQNTHTIFESRNLIWKLFSVLNLIAQNKKVGDGEFYCTYKKNTYDDFANSL